MRLSARAAAKTPSARNYGRESGLQPDDVPHLPLVTGRLPCKVHSDRNTMHSLDCLHDTNANDNAAKPLGNPGGCVNPNYPPTLLQTSRTFCAFYPSTGQQCTPLHVVFTYTRFHIYGLWFK